MRTRLTLAAGLLACVFSGQANAEDCKSLQYLTGVPIVVGDMVLMPITLGQKTAAIMFDSGGGANQLTHSTVQELNLLQEESPIHMLDVSGRESSTFVTVDSVTWGSLKLNKMQFQVATMDELSKANIAGLISNSVLNAVDVDLDFGADRLNLFSPDHCPGKVVYWPAQAVAAVPYNRNSVNIIVPVELDGHTMRAVIDTGATRTYMNIHDAKGTFDLTPGTPDTPALKGLVNGDKNLNTYGHTFASLSFEGVTIQNPSVVIMPDRVSSQQNAVTGSHLANPNTKLPELQIGLDVLKKLHVYFSGREHILYITPADDKAGKLLPAAVGSPVTQSATTGASPP